MKKWKVNWEYKKKEILKMERVRINEEKEYQGEWLDGKREGFGIMFWVNGTY